MEPALPTSNSRTAGLPVLLIGGLLALAALADPQYAFVLSAILGILLLARLLFPATICLGWPLVLISYVLIPAINLDPDTKLAFVPLEYFPLLLVLGCGSLCTCLRRARNPVRIPAPLKLFAFAIIGIVLASVLWVQNPVLWTQHAAMWLMYMGSCLLIAKGLAQDSAQRHMQYLDRLFVLLSIFLMLVLIRNFLSPSSRFSSGFDIWLNPLDFSPFIRYRISQVMIVTPLIPVAFMMYIAKPKRIYGVFVLLSSLAVLLSFSRTAMIGLVVGSVTAVVLSRFEPGIASRLRLQRTAVQLAVILAGFGGAIYVAGEFVVRRVESISQVQGVWSGELSLSDEAGGRVVIIQEATRIFGEHPFIGTGAGNYLEYFDRSLRVLPMTPHNQYLGFLAEFGILGFILLAGFLFSLLRLLWNRASRVSDLKTRLLLKGFFAGQVMLLVMFLGTDVFTTPYIWFYWSLSLSFAIRHYATNPAGAFTMRPQESAR
ncbi:MAG: O-antigen ligase family protein [Acidobacteria bacterium]|nr:O-antigen ligase family protein [Acidobacteriota bacterium]